MSLQFKPDDLRPEYTFDYSKARPNRFAERITEENTDILRSRSLEQEVFDILDEPEA